MRRYSTDQNMAKQRVCDLCGTQLSAADAGGVCIACALKGVLGASAAPMVDTAAAAGACRDLSPPRSVSGNATGRGPATTRDLNADARLGECVGSYKILETLGEGGCGIVYLAEQRQPLLRRVALKVIKPGMDSRQVLARRDRGMGGIGPIGLD